MAAKGGYPQKEERDMRPDEKGGAPGDFTGLAIRVAREPWTWSGLDFGSGPNSASFLLQLGGEDIRKVEESLCAFKQLELDGDEVNRNNFRLPTLEQRLEHAANNIHQGCGFCVIRGLNPARYSAEDNLMIFLGITDYIGDIRGMQDRKGNMISHITDSKLWRVSSTLRHGIHTNSALPFHNDMGTDILALQVRQCARTGGNTYLASASKLFCELVATEPEVVPVLFEPNWPIQISGRPVRYVLAPLMQYHDGKLMISIDPGRLGPLPASARTTQNLSHSGSPPTSAVPVLTPTQQHALAALSTAATRHRLPLDAQPGDIVLVNNWGLLHAREAYTDSDDAGVGSGAWTGEIGREKTAEQHYGQRHLLRLWLRNSRLAWAVPAAMRAPWERAFGPDGTGSTTPNTNDRRRSGSGGVVALPVQRLYPVLPAPEYKIPKYTAGSAAFVVEDSDCDEED